MFQTLTKHKFSILISILLLIIVILSYGQILNMFYWIDDWGLVFNMIHPTIFPGNLGHPAYRHTTAPFNFLYPFIGLNSSIYFLLTIVQYYLASLLVFFSLRSITKNNLIAISSAIVFASGYVGSYAMYRLSNSFQLVETAIVIILIFWFLSLYYKTSKNIFFISTLILYTFALEFLFLRSQGILLIIIATSLFLKFPNLNVSEIKQFIFRHTPFFLIYYFFNFIDERVRPGGSSASGDAVKQIIDAIFIERNYALLDNLIISFINTIIPQSFTSSIYTDLPKFFLDRFSLNISANEMLIIPALAVAVVIVAFYLRKRDYLFSSIILLILDVAAFIYVFWSSAKTHTLWNPSKLEIFTASVGIQFIILVFWLYVRFRKTEAVAAKLLLLGLVWIFSVLVAYYIYSPFTSLETTSRYLIPGFIGSSILIGTLIYLFPRLFAITRVNSALLTLTLALVISSYLITNARAEQLKIVTTISNPSRFGFETLKKEMGSINQNNIFHFEIIDNPVLRGNILGGMPHIAVSVAAGYNDGAKIADSYDHLFYLLKSGQTKLEDTHTFFVSDNEFINTSSKFKELLSQVQDSKDISRWEANTDSEDMNTFPALLVSIQNGTVGVSPTITAALNQDSLTPNELILNMTIEPLKLHSIQYPYYDYSKEFADKIDKSAIEKLIPILKKELSEKNILLSLEEESVKKYLREFGAVSTSTEGKTTIASNLNDGRLDTNWSAHSTNWNSIERPVEVIFDLGRILPISNFYWVNHHHSSTPTEYTIYHSNDSINWIELYKKEDGGRLDGKVVVRETLGDINTRFIRMSIHDTYSGIGYPPAIEEVWVSNIKNELGFEIKSQIVECPFCQIMSSRQEVEVSNLVVNLGQARISWITDRTSKYASESFSKFNLYLDGLEHQYKIYLPADGQKLKQIKIDMFPIPVKVTIHSASIRSLSLQELIDLNLLKDFGED